MYDVSAFAIWKFKTVEGNLKNISSLDFTSSRYDDGRIKATIKYDVDNHTVEIVYDNDKMLPVSCKFDQVVNTLKQCKMYAVRTDNVSSNANIPFEGNPLKI